MMVDFLHLKHETYQFGKEDVLKFYPKVVEALKKYDPMEIRNSLPVYIGLTLLKAKGIKTVFTGDALDELFGYPWQFHLTEEQFAVNSKKCGLKWVSHPSPWQNRWAWKSKHPTWTLNSRNGQRSSPSNTKLTCTTAVKYGKWILRKAYEDVIPKEAIWRPKAPLEAGTGTETLRTYFNDTFTRRRIQRKSR